MDLFLDFITKLAPIYFLIGVGYFMGKKLPVKRETVSSLLVYFITPVVIFNSVYTTKITPSLALLPVMFFVLCSVIAVGAYILNKNVKPSGMRGVLGMAAGSGNTGYFGIPVALALFGEDAVGLVVLCVFGFLVYETTVGFILIARDKNTLKESIIKLLKLPVLYAFFAGLFVQLAGLNLGSVYANFVPNFRGAYVVLGSMIVGIALSKLKKSHMEWSIIVRSFTTRFVVWPAVIVALILLDKNMLHIFAGRSDIYQVMFLMSIVPLAANTVAYATFLKTEPERAAFIIFASTVFAIIYIPIMTSFVLPHIV